MQAKTERFEMRLDQMTLDKVDAWRANQTDFPSRAEAIRRLIEAGMPGNSKDQLKLSSGEKLIALMLCELYEHLEIDGEIEPTFIQSAIHGGHLWGLQWRYPGIFQGEEDDNRVLKEVVDVLNMWTFIESAYQRLSKKDKGRVEKEADPFGKHVAFPGFDGNYECEHLSIATFLIEDMGRFSDFKDRDLNSHATLLDSYRRMLRVFEPMRRNLVGARLNPSQIIDILKAME